MFLHNLTLALRNLCKYKLQTVISVLSLAIGIVTISLVYSVMQRFRPANIQDQPYYDRVYELYIESKDSARANMRMPMRHDDFNNLRSMVRIQEDILQALKRDGGMQCTGTDIYVGNDVVYSLSSVVIRCSDGTELKTKVCPLPIDPGFPRFWGYRSAITGELVDVLKPGEVLISKAQAKKIFGDENPIGATTSLGFDETYTVTIADVVDYMPPSAVAPDGQQWLFSMDDWERQVGYAIVSRSVFVVLKPGATVEQLEREANERLKPLNMVASVVNTKEYEQKSSNSRFLARTISHGIGSLILLVAIIGFLRMQVQLFWMRRREVSLRIVHGAHFRQLYVQLLVEVGLAVSAAVALSIPMGWWLEDFASHYLQDYMGDDLLHIKQLGVYCLTVGAVVWLLCALVVWLTLRRIYHSVQNLAEGLRGTRNHLFRNVMLCVQITLCLVFVCGTLVATRWTFFIQGLYCLPDDEAAFRRTAKVRLWKSEHRIPLRDALMQLPNVETCVPLSMIREEFEQLNSIPDIAFRPAFDDCLIDNGNLVFRTYLTADTAFLQLYEMDVKWSRRDVDRTHCILVQEDLYRLMTECGATQNGELTMARSGLTLPIAGTFDKVLFNERNAVGQYRLVAVSPGLPERPDELLMQAKEGHYDEMMRDIEATVQRLEPGLIDQLAENQMDYAMGYLELNLVMAVRHAGWILSAVALLVCAMSVYSTIALDTRARRKEMAIRKINGAKRGDIARIFVRLYVVCLSLAVVVAVPLTCMFNEVLRRYVASYRAEEITALSVLPSLAGGILLVLLTVALIVGWHVHGIMRVNPACIIAKE